MIMIDGATDKSSESRQLSTGSIAKFLGGQGGRIEVAHSVRGGWRMPADKALHLQNLATTFSRSVENTEALDGAWVLMSTTNY